VSENDILTGLAEIVNEITGIKRDQVVPTATFVDDLDIDSLSMVEVAVAAEERFGVRIPDEELAKLKTVGDAVTFIQKQGVPA
jgi:acyl carrier protein